jgi:hypothetical protein
MFSVFRFDSSTTESNYINNILVFYIYKTIYKQALFRFYQNTQKQVDRQTSNSHVGKLID